MPEVIFKPTNGRTLTKGGLYATFDASNIQSFRPGQCTGSRGTSKNKSVSVVYVYLNNDFYTYNEWRTQACHSYKCRLSFFKYSSFNSKNSFDFISDQNSSSSPADLKQSKSKGSRPGTRRRRKSTLSEDETPSSNSNPLTHNISSFSHSNNSLSQQSLSKSESDSANVSSEGGTRRREECSEKWSTIQKHQKSKLFIL